MIWLLTAVASAYTLSGNSWIYHDQPVEEPFVIATGSFPSQFPAADLLRAHAEALRVWNVQGGADLRLQAGGDTSVTQYGSGNNDSNNVAWESFRWGATLGIAARTVVGDEIRDCDIQIVGANSSGDTYWSLADGGAPAGMNDMRHTLVHEMGHCIGVDHSNVDSALMGPYAPSDQGPDSRVLKGDDIQAVQAVYGVASPSLIVADVVSVADDLGVTVTITVENVGDGSAWGVLSDGELDEQAPAELVSWLGELGDVEVGASVGSAGDAVVGRIAWSDSCVGTTEVALAFLLSDESGNLWTDELGIALPCPEAGLGAGPSAACGCASSGGRASGGLVLAFGAALWRRRRR